MLKDRLGIRLFRISLYSVFFLLTLIGTDFLIDPKQDNMNGFILGQLFLLVVLALIVGEGFYFLVKKGW